MSPSIPCAATAFATAPAASAARCCRVCCWHELPASRALASVVVLGAEVTYAPSACATLAAALASLLGPPPAPALIASKRYYFGVGGGVDAFTRAAEGAGLVVSLLATAVGPVPRDVLLVRRRE